MIQMVTNKIHEKVLFPELSYVLVGILFSTHNEIGPYAREKQYNDLIEIKLKESNIPYKREFKIAESGNILDFLINDKIILETKTTRIITKEHYRQIQNYLQITGIKLGILVNFSNRYIKPIRVLRMDI